MGDWESKKYDDELDDIRHRHIDPEAEQKEAERLARRMRKKMEEEMWRQTAGIPVYDPHGNPYVPMPTAKDAPVSVDKSGSIFGIDPSTYKEWKSKQSNKRPQRRSGAKQVDPNSLPQHVIDELNRQMLPGFPPIIKSNGKSPKYVAIDELDVYLGDYPHMDPISRKQESCRHHPINVGFNTDKWVCKICDKDLDAPIDWDTKQ